jgi:phosphoribosylanthranilate isomerase
MTVRVHINGLTRPEDASAAAEAGADAFGVFFWRQSRSSVSVPQAKEIVDALPPDALTIGMFVDAVSRTVDRTLEQTGVKMALFAGGEDPDYCAQFSGRYARVIRVKNIASLDEILRYDCPFHVLDGDPAVQAGVREIPFDLVLARRAKRFGNVVISGGLTPENVAKAVASCRPWGVEVSSGVESVQGIKDPRKLERFIEACRSA